MNHFLPTPKTGGIRGVTTRVLRRPFILGLTLLLIAVVVFTPAAADPPAAQGAAVDLRFELLTIVARLAGFEEFGESRGAYAAAVDAHFRGHRDHPAVQSMRRLRAENGVGYDAVPNLAAHLQPAPSLAPRLEFTATAPDSRWGATNATFFSRLLADFYRDARCAEFFKAQTPTFSEAARRLDQHYARVDLGWYDAFYGRRPEGRFHLVVGMLNGPGNFSSTVRLPDGSEDMYASIGIWKYDDGGRPLFGYDSLPLVIHEYSHCFVNRLVLEQENALRSAGEKLFPRVADEMRRQAYNAWQTLMIESVVRAAVVKYAEKHPFPGISTRQIIAHEELIGFVWTGDLVRLLDDYEGARAQYPTLRDFMPRIVQFMDGVPPRLDHLLARRHEFTPRLAGAEPFPNQAVDVDESTPRLTLRFDRDLQPGMDPGSPGPESPLAEPLRLGADRRSLSAPLRLKVAQRYEIILPANSVVSAEGYPMRDNLVFEFSTRGYQSPGDGLPFGYRIEDNEVVFIANRPNEAPADYKIERYCVAGEFNAWNPQADGFTMATQDGQHYELRLPRARVGEPGAVRQFKFVIDGRIWLDVPSGATNVIRTAEGHRNLTLTLP